MSRCGPPGDGPGDGIEAERESIRGRWLASRCRRAARVRARLDGSRPNHGLRLATRRGNVEWTGNCAVYFGDFALTVHLAE